MKTGMVVALAVLGLLMALPVQAQMAKQGEYNITSGCASDGSIHQMEPNHIVWVGKFRCAGYADSAFLKQSAWDCPAINNIAGGKANLSGYCAVTDGDGDKLFVEFSGSWPADKPVGGGEGKLTGGTGKYAGVQGGHSFSCTFMGTEAPCQLKGKYRLP